MTLTALPALERHLTSVGGTVSIWCGPPGSDPVHAREPHATHYAASTMKLAVMAAAFRLADVGKLDLDTEVAVHDEFASATGHGTFRNRADYDNDTEPWKRLGRTAPLRWLIRRMIVMSSNLATNIVLEQVWSADRGAVADVWATAGASAAITPCGIEDYAARDAGLRNIVTAADLAALLSSIRLQRLTGPTSCAEMIDMLLGQEVVHDIVQGLPVGVRVAHKNGWVAGVHHSVALVMPDDAPEFVLATCITADLTHKLGWELLARVAAAAWADRHAIGSR